MKAFLNHSLFLWAIRLILGGIFLYAGILKVINPLAFADNIDQYEILPNAFINIVALCLPAFECVVGLLLLSGRFDRLASGSIVVMCLIFGVALVSAIVRGLVIDCGCFGTSEPSRWSAWYALGRDILMLLAAGWLYFLKRHEASLSHS